MHKHPQRPTNDPRNLKKKKKSRRERIKLGYATPSAVVAEPDFGSSPCRWTLRLFQFERNFFKKEGEKSTTWTLRLFRHILKLGCATRVVLRLPNPISSRPLHCIDNWVRQFQLWVAETSLVKMSKFIRFGNPNGNPDVAEPISDPISLISVPFQRQFAYCAAGKGRLRRKNMKLI